MRALNPATGSVVPMLHDGTLYGPSVKGRWVHVAFANPLKCMLATLIGWDAINDRVLRETPHPALGGKTPRYAMQTLGTEWGRESIDGDVWVQAWRESALTVLDVGGHVVTDDLRFPNEEKAVVAMGGCIIKVNRPGVDYDESHASERYRPNYHYAVLNNNTPQALQACVRELVALYRNRLQANDWNGPDTP